MTAMQKVYVEALGRVVRREGEQTDAIQVMTESWWRMGVDESEGAVNIAADMGLVSQETRDMVQATRRSQREKKTRATAQGR